MTIAGNSLTECIHKYEKDLYFTFLVHICLYCFSREGKPLLKKKINEVNGFRGGHAINSELFRDFPISK